MVVAQDPVISGWRVLGLVAAVAICIRWVTAHAAPVSEPAKVSEPAQIRVPTHLLAVSGDWLAPPEDLRAFAAAIAAPAQFECIDSLFGHDAFLKETDRVGALIARALSAPIANEVH